MNVRVGAAFIFVAESTACHEYSPAPIQRAHLAPSMSERQTGPYDTIARRWLALVERRQEHFIELCDSGRWRHYYTHAEFLHEMRKVLQVRDQWAMIVGLPPHDEGASLHVEQALLDDEILTVTGEDLLSPQQTPSSDGDELPSYQAELSAELPPAPWPD
jgi:hypothetical protein